MAYDLKLAARIRLLLKARKGFGGLGEKDEPAWRRV